MKLILVTALLFVTVQAQQGSPVFDLVITDVGSAATVVGDSRNPQCAPDDNDPACVHITFDIPLENWQFTKWPDKPVKGQILKGAWDGQGRFQTVASCAVRTQQAREKVCKEAGYDCARFPVNSNPLNSVSPPDCSAPPSKFITEFLQKLR